ncbi:MAG TPA: DUF4184 family protein [Terriglobales bacterium]|nr:DUF4184 family protein [Terriglobales bacterium]
MPFTVAHAAAVLPLRKLKLVWSAAIIGSMAPDFPYVIGNIEYRDLGHQFPGVLWFTLPASFAALWLFHNMIKRPVIGLLPTGMQERLHRQSGDFKFGPASRFLAILGSISLGIATHLVWDAFTHYNSWPWRHIAWLRGRLSVPFVHHHMPVFSALQYASSVVGMLALAIWVLLWYRSAPTVAAATSRPRSRFALAVAMLAIAAAVGTLRAVLVVGPPVSLGRINIFLLISGVTSLAAAFWQLLFYCVLVSSYQMWVIP